MSRLVFLAVLLISLEAVLAKPHEEPTKEHAKEVAHECQTETGATDDDVAQLMKHESAESHEAKCLHACVMKKFGIMDEAGKLSPERALEMIKILSKDDEEKAAAATVIVSKCEGIEVPEDHCDAAHAYEGCIYEHMQEQGLLLEEE